MPGPGVGGPQGRAPDRDPTRRLAALAIAALWLLRPARRRRPRPVRVPPARPGSPAPACGLTRSWAAALHGRPRESLRFHPLGPLALGAAMAYAARLDERPGLRRDGRTRRGGPRPGAGLERAAPVLVGAWLVVWLARMAAEARRAR